MQDNAANHSQAIKRRRHLAFVMALMISGVVFGPWSYSLYQDGSRFFLLIVGFLWLAVGRFFYQMFSPPVREQHQAARDDTDQ